MDAADIHHLLLTHFSFSPTDSQESVLEELAYFLADEEEQKLFLLRGFAGTGKTTLINTLVKVLGSLSKKIVLLAPTGRAAKVITSYAKQKAFTIHKYIYQPINEESGFFFNLRTNKASDTLFIVDEASMIGEGANFGSRSLLSDLIEFVYSGDQCQLMLIGDTAQLPPVHTEISPALDYERLSYYYHKDVTEGILTDVVRQGKKSGILYNATRLRKRIESFKNNFRIRTFPFKDITLLENPYQVEEALINAYQVSGTEETCFIVRSNKRAVEYNRQIRKVVFEYEEPLCVGDLLMVVKNNYLWIDSTSIAGFIANGDILKVLEINSIEKIYGFTFAHILAQLLDYPTLEPFETILFLDTLESPLAALSSEEQNRLYHSILQEYNRQTGQIVPLNMKLHPYYNALQVKYAYAITCHKSQGGQWDNVFIEKPFLPDGQSIAYFRWLYTALTRAKEDVFLINFPSEDIIP
ncbi:ATP-dependent DNA helicase [Capnocytophaga sp. G2]|uniref:ATP-dependent DNA helicase n=1 Tax=Capnocytophaga sp. G2 TaxID=3110695 RepID=UPI002B473F50|nr:AAA family ATPase [Capnocytophaga sp. G2]MEB3005440.1 AAA family ATPase [Capnocytophaga sp. G2]